jgi:hypothetical protein
MTHAAVPHSNAVFAAQPLSRKTPPEREVGRSNRPGRVSGMPVVERVLGSGVVGTRDERSVI